MEEGIYEVKFKDEEKLRPLIEADWIPKYFAFYQGKDPSKTICLPLRKTEMGYLPQIPPIFSIIDIPIEKYTESDYLGDPSRGGKIDTKLFISLEKIMSLDEAGPSKLKGIEDLSQFSIF